MSYHQQQPTEWGDDFNIGLDLGLLDPLPSSGLEDFTIPSSGAVSEIVGLGQTQTSVVEPDSSLMADADQSTIPWLTGDPQNVSTIGPNSVIPFDDVSSPINPFTDTLYNMHGTDPLFFNSGAVGNPSTQIQGWTPDAAPTSRTGLPRRRSRYFPSRSGQSAPIQIPNNLSLDPMQRWQESPPEDEPASMAAILDAVRNAPVESTSRPRSGGSSQGHSTPNSYRPRRHRTRSTTSVGSSATSRRSANSATSGSLSLDSVTMAPRKSRARSFKPKHSINPDDKDRKFCCTFCCDRFKNKYDWARHEKSLHLNLEAWVCAPHGPSIVSPMTRRTHCAFCSALDPPQEHFNEHNYQACQTGTNEFRAFRRKDHLVQHLRVVHHLETLPSIDDWKLAAPTISSRCGFCDQSLATWNDRVNHLADHFRQGATMKDWRGDHGLAPSISARVTHALPPYLIASEAQTLIPFSATSTEIQDHFAQISSRADWQGDRTTNGPSTSADPMSPADQLSSFTQVLTLHLSRYARQQIQLGVVPTDEMFQRESRRVLYDCEDSWNQSIADNPEWLAAFRRLLEEQQNATEQRGVVS